MLLHICYLSHPHTWFTQYLNLALDLHTKHLTLRVDGHGDQNCKSRTLIFYKMKEGTFKTPPICLASSPSKFPIIIVFMANLDTSSCESSGEKI